MPKVVRAVLEPVEWEYGKQVWRLMHDIETAPELLEPDETGRMVPPTAAQAVEWLPLIVDEKQHKKLATAIEKNTWPAADRYAAVQGWWRYMIADSLQAAKWAHAAKLRGLTAQLDDVVAEVLPPEDEDTDTPLDEG